MHKPEEAPRFEGSCGSLDAAFVVFCVEPEGCPERYDGLVVDDVQGSTTRGQASLACNCQISEGSVHRLNGYLTGPFFKLQWRYTAVEVGEPWLRRKGGAGGYRYCRLPSSRGTALFLVSPPLLPFGALPTPHSDAENSQRPGNASALSVWHAKEW